MGECNVLNSVIRIHNAFPDLEHISPNVCALSLVQPLLMVLRTFISSRADTGLTLGCKKEICYLVRLLQYFNPFIHR